MSSSFSISNGILRLFVMSLLLCIVNSALPPRSSQDLQLDATHIVTGLVTSIDVNTENASTWIDTWYTVTLMLHQLEKGDMALQSDGERGAQITFKYFKRRFLNGMVGDSGMYTHVEKGSSIRAFLRCENRDGSECFAMNPNGITILKNEGNIINNKNSNSIDVNGKGGTWYQLFGTALLVVVACSITYVLTNQIPFLRNIYYPGHYVGQEASDPN